MALSLSLRFVTTLAVCAVCVPAILEGAMVTRFAIAEMRLDPTQNGLEALKGWRNQTGVAAEARDPSLQRATDRGADAVERQRAALKDYLAIKPLAPVKWLALADSDLSAGEPTDVTVRAYAMAQVTGPYEGYLMPRRAVLGTLLWERLGPDERIRAARDLALAELTTQQELVLKAILAAKLQDTRDAVRFEMLQIEGLQADRLNKLGLQ